MRSQLRRSLTRPGVRARIASGIPFDGTLLATRIGLALPTTPLSGRRRPLVGAGLLADATGLVFEIAICATGCAELLVGVPTGPEATVSTTPVEV